MPGPFLAGCAAGALVVSAYHARRSIVREARWAWRDITTLRIEMAGYRR